jgi:hypothetical protein
MRQPRPRPDSHNLAGDLHAGPEREHRRSQQDHRGHEPRRRGEPPRDRERDKSEQREAEVRAVLGSGRSEPLGDRVRDRRAQPRPLRWDDVTEHVRRLREGRPGRRGGVRCNRVPDDRGDGDRGDQHRDPALDDRPAHGAPPEEESRDRRGDAADKDEREEDLRQDRELRHEHDREKHDEVPARPHVGVAVEHEVRDERYERDGCERQVAEEVSELVRREAEHVSGDERRGEPRRDAVREQERRRRGERRCQEDQDVVRRHGPDESRQRRDDEREASARGSEPEVEPLRRPGDIDVERVPPGPEGERPPLERPHVQRLVGSSIADDAPRRVRDDVTAEEQQRDRRVDRRRARRTGRAASEATSPVPPPQSHDCEARSRRSRGSHAGRTGARPTRPSCVARSHERGLR